MIIKGGFGLLFLFPGFRKQVVKGMIFRINSRGIEDVSYYWNGNLILFICVFFLDFLLIISFS